MIPEQFEHIARALPEPMLLVGGGGPILGCNPPMVSLLGRPREALLEHTLYGLVRDDPDDVEKYLGACARSRAMVLGSLVFAGSEEAPLPLRCEGAVLRPWTSEDDALIVLRCKPQTAASNRFVLLNQKIQELSREIHVRKAAERERERLLQREQTARARAEASEARMAFLAELFEPFRQESIGLNRAYEGTGLGLAITKRLVTLMHGTIDVSSDKGQGSVFTITFATTQPDPPPPQLPVQQMAQAQQETSDAARPHLLVVEDNPDTQVLMQYVLEEQFEVTIASNAEEAVRAAQARRFGIVLMDINLGKGPSGEEVLSMLRAMPAYATAPIVAVTAYALPSDRERFLKHGFDAYLSKPFDPDALLRLAMTLLIH